MEERIIKSLEEWGLNWEVEKVRLYQMGTPDVETPYAVTMRKDTGDMFGVFKDDSYEVFQNAELFELIDRISSRSNMEIKKAGYFKGGARVFIQLESGSIKGIGENDDTVNTYITGINTHDGFSALKFGDSSTVISCENTFHAAHKQLTGSIRHTQNMRKLLDLALAGVDDALDMQDQTTETFFRLASQEATYEDILDMCARVLDFDKTKMEDLSPRKFNQFNQLNMCILDEMREKGMTKWGLFNGVTKYTTHFGGTDKTRDMGKMFGTGKRMDNMAFASLK